MPQTKGKVREKGKNVSFLNSRPTRICYTERRKARIGKGKTRSSREQRPCNKSQHKARKTKAALEASRDRLCSAAEGQPAPV